MKKSPDSLVIVYTGDGKGKTTAALGLAFRALGRGLRVAVVQFIKSSGWRTGERLMAEKTPGLDFHTLGRGFTWLSEDLGQDAGAARAAWRKAASLIAAGAHDVVILDEVTYPLVLGFVPLKTVLAALRSRPRHVNVVLTGRDAPAALVKAADLVSEMRMVKHPFQQGRSAKKGIDF